MEEAWSLKGATALVTGATKGIGRAVAEELARQGVHVWVCARTSADLERCLEEWGSAEWEGSIKGSMCDVSNTEARQKLVSVITQHFFGSLSILVNNVGLPDPPPSPFEKSGDSQFHNVMASNVEAALHLSQLTHPLMKANGKGSIIFNSSIAGSYTLGLGFPTKLYSATKGALNQLAKDLAFDWAKDNIRVNSIAAGYTHTDLIKNNVPMPTVRSLEERIPLRRFAKPTEIACVVAFLCMPSASYITGSIITVDGGMTSHISPFSCMPTEEAKV